MAQNRSGHRQGIESRKRRSARRQNRQRVAQCQASRNAQIGTMYGTHVTRHSESNYRGEKLHNPERNFQPTKFGNEVALNVGKGGCGTGRTIYKTGTQDQHGGVAGTPRPAGRGILNNE